MHATPPGSLRPRREALEKRRHEGVLPGLIHPFGATQHDGHHRCPEDDLDSWRYDENLMILGEDAYSGGPVEMRELSDEELPADYRALL